MEVFFERQIILLSYRLPHVTATRYTVYLYVNIWNTNKLAAKDIHVL